MARFRIFVWHNRQFRCDVSHGADTRCMTHVVATYDGANKKIYLNACRMQA